MPNWKIGGLADWKIKAANLVVGMTGFEPATP
jgi:hypothetical protein